MRTTNLPRVVLHVDMDAFYASVEAREDPSLAGRPLIVGHKGARGVVLTCSYEARRSGVRSAMPSVTAMRLCPDAVWLRARMDLYSRVSRRIHRIFRDVTPVVEALSIDEAFLDFTGLAANLEEGRKAARRIKDRIHAEEGLTASVGVAPNKFLAKVASDMEKPDGLVVLAHEDLPHRFWPLPVETLWGIGPRTAARLRAASVLTVGDVLRVSEEHLAGVIGPHGAARMRSLAAGEDHRRVIPVRRAKSISEERTYGRNLIKWDDIDREILARSVDVARRLRRQGLVARTVNLKVRAPDFTTWTRSKTLTEPTDLAGPIVATARELFPKVPLGRKGVRLLGVGVSGIVKPERAGQAELFPDPTRERARKLARAADTIRSRFGGNALTRARLAKRRE